MTASVRYCDARIQSEIILVLEVTRIAAVTDGSLLRSELGEFLRARREGLRPEDVDLPATGRRRTPGLRREELAVLAGISVTWYTSLEQGRDVSASDQVLEALARALRMNPPERAHLLALAGARRDQQPDGTGAPALAAVVAALQPNPAYATDAAFDLLAVNDAALELFRGMEGTGARPRNLVRWMFTDPVAHQVLVDWDDVAGDLLARLRATAGRRRGDPRLAALVAELRASSEEADTWWPRYAVAAPHTGTKRVRHPRTGQQTLTHTVFSVADRTHHTLVVYTPERADPVGVAFVADVVDELGVQYRPVHGVRDRAECGGAATVG